MADNDLVAFRLLDPSQQTRTAAEDETPDPMDECHNCGCVRDDHAKIGGSWCMNQDAQGPCGCRAFVEPAPVGAAVPADPNKED